MKKIIFPLLALIFSFSLLAQTNPTPYELKSGAFVFTNFGNQTFNGVWPEYFQGWSGAPPSLAQGVPTTLQATGDEDLCVGCGTDQGRFYESSTNGIGMQHHVAGTGSCFALALALNTKGCQDIDVSWFALVDDWHNDPSVTGVEMQYRIGESGDWNAFSDQTFLADHSSIGAMDYQEFSVRLPEECNNQDVVQLRWALFNGTNFTFMNSLAISRITVLPQVVEGENTNGYCKAYANIECSDANPFWNSYKGQYIYEFSSLSGLGGIDNPNESCGLVNGYSDYTNISWTVAPGETVDLYARKSPGYTNDDVYIKVYADWNGDFDFEDLDEVIDMVKLPGSTEFAGTISVPMTAERGKTRLRVRLDGEPIFEPCGPTADGEIEDYTLIVSSFIDTANTPSPAHRTENLCQNGGVTLSWNSPKEGADPAGYRLNFGTDNPPSNLANNVDLGTDTFYHYLENLEPNETYYWQVIPYDDEGDARFNPVWEFSSVQNGDPVPSIYYNKFPAVNVDLCLNTDAMLSVQGVLDLSVVEWTGTGSSNLSTINDDTTYYTGSFETEDTLFLYVEDQFGCKGYDTLLIKVNPLPETGSIQGELAKCTGDDFEFLHSGTQNEIKWILKRNTIWEDIPEANTLGLVYKNAQDGDLISTVISDEFCSDTTEVIALTVHEISDAPDITANLIQGKICEGSDAGLVSSKGASSIWSNEEMAESISVSESGEYWVYYLDDNNCPSDTAYIEVGVIPSPPKPVVNELEAGENNFCEGKLVTLTVSDLGFDINWVNQNINNQTLITLQSSTVVVVTYTDEFGCKSTSETYEVQFRENPEEPQIFNSDDFQFCKGDSTVLFTNSQDQVTWNDGNNTTGKELVVKFPGRYRAFVVNEFMCENRSEFVEVEELAVPNKPSFELSNLEFCDGDSVQLTANSEVSIFRDGAFVADSKDVYVSTPGQYHVVKNAVNGCSAVSDTIMLIENALPEKPTAVIPSGNAEMCEGDTILIVEVGGREVYWNDGTNELKQKIYVHTEGDYYAETRNEKCVNRSDAISVKVNPNPEFPYLYINGDSLQTINTEGYLVQWYYTNGAEVPNGDNEAILYDSSKDYYVEFTDPSTGCSTMSEVYLGLTEFQAKLSLKLYPNPVRKGDLVGFELNENTDFVLSVYDLNGRRVLTSTNEKISTIDLALGTYSVILESDKGNYYGKLVVM